MPSVTASVACAGLRPDAKAFGCGPGVRAYAVFGNGGELVRPHFLLERGTPLHPGKPLQTAVSRSTCSAMMPMLEAVVEEGTGKKAAVSGYRIGGKTGTARKPPYKDRRYMSSFWGIAPSRDPRLVVGVVMDEPKGEYYGSLVAAPVFKTLTEYTLRKLGVVPERLPAGKGG